jgi:hypothetical protein
MKPRAIFLLFMILVFFAGPVACGHKGPPTPPKADDLKKST